jgi:putative endonuclease
VVFVEVRRRQSARQGGALASIGAVKRQRIVYAAQHYLRAWGQWPPCRFDVVVVQAGELQWLQAAFTA